VLERERAQKRGVYWPNRLVCIDRFHIDSAGTIDCHEVSGFLLLGVQGDPGDSRMLGEPPACGTTTLPLHSQLSTHRFQPFCGTLFVGVQGDQADVRMRRAASQRGIDITSISRPIRPSDFAEFDVIMAMDNKNTE